MLKTVQWSVVVVIIIIIIIIVIIIIIAIVVVIVFVDDDTYYWVYGSFEHPFQVDKVRQVLSHGATGITKCDRTLSCEYLRASLCKILISSFARKMDFAHNFSVDFF